MKLKHYAILALFLGALYLGCVGFSQVVYETVSQTSAWETGLAIWVGFAIYALVAISE